jgi:hypothetical protein
MTQSSAVKGRGKTWWFPRKDAPVRSTGDNARGTPGFARATEPKAREETR